VCIKRRIRRKRRIKRKRRNGYRLEIKAEKTKEFY
jgi:hypothetical protein